MYAVSVPTDLEFHKWVKELGLKPCERVGNPGDAIWIPPTEPHRSQVLSGLTVDDPKFLVGSFSDDERAALLPKAAASKPVAAKPADA